MNIDMRSTCKSTCHVLEGVQDDGVVEIEIFIRDADDTFSFAGEDCEGDDKEGGELDCRHHSGRSGRR